MKRLILSTAACLISMPISAADDAGAKQDFAQKASMSNMFEIEAAKIEISKGRAVDAKQFAQDMLRDYGRAVAPLADAAKNDGVTVSQSLDVAHQQKLDALRNSDAANLDQAYLSTQVIAHQQAYEIFKAYSKEGPDGSLKNTAAKMLPDLHMHLTRVQGMANK
ncbi:putative outer membrane protein [Rhizobium leguminosarum bv. trifolii WSM597]|uniref:Putative outer membrane protein n=1 Tax=Rhizobium leguminosarum bv. trifolii WSM597 TaxID=754764 RepID=J0GW09_RHILT|nr:DUF4142 domain-containing protein [Rhizobium leguminosarum]EJB01785.1 putative outer membrane protein [Rhizobium leguminosarum bv. trifolii WSM597]